MAAPLRFDEPGLREGNQITLAGWHRADGYAGLQPQRRLDYHQLAALRVAGVRWVRRSEATDRIPGLIAHNADWLEVPRPLSRVRLVTQARASDDPAGDLQTIDPESTALTDSLFELPPGAPGEATILDDRPGRLHIRANCSTRQLLVVSESYHPGWQATVDHRPRDVLRVNGDFFGCVVGPGEHDVRFEFRPRSLRYGRTLSWIGLGCVVIGVIGCRFSCRFSGAVRDRSTRAARAGEEASDE
jgi:hypothetical protein